MRLVTYESNGHWSAGVAVQDWIVDAARAAGAAGLPGSEGDDWTSNRRIIQAPAKQLAALERAARELAEDPGEQPAVHPLTVIRLGPPIPDPDKIICIGLNYRSHAAETGLSTTAVPTLFAKYPNALNGPTSSIRLPGFSREIDYEGELAVVIGRQCKDISVAQALDYVAGYMAFNDVSARDLQMRTSQWLAGKTLDTFAPCGPALVVGEIADPQTLSVRTRVNGETLQDGRTSDMIFPVAESLAYISQLVTLQPGDIIATGTPDGVGFKRNPPVFLQPGDLVEVEIEGVGMLRNPVVAS